MEIDKYISELLYDYDCVVVPQLGGFVTNYRPSGLDIGSGIAHPPSKDIRFNKNLTKSDGLLERAVSDKSKLSFEEAGAIIKIAVEAYWSKLNGGEKVKFHKVGLLYIDDHKNLRFEPATGINYLKSSYGLEAFTLPPIVLQKAEDEDENTGREAAEIIPFEKVSGGRSRSIYWVAAATLLPFIGMSLYMGLTTNFKSPTDLTLAELIPSVRSTPAKGLYNIRTTAADLESAGESEATAFPEGVAVFPFSFSENRLDSNGVWVDLREKNLSVPSALSEGPYHIIAGCFGDASNAEQYVEKLRSKGYSAAILDYHKKLHRVKLESYGDYSEALNTLQHLREDRIFPNAWLLKKPV